MLQRLAFLVAIALSASLPSFAGSGGEAGRYLESDEYLRSAFAAEVPAARTLWVSGDLRASLEQVLGHPFGRLRVRFWQHGARSAWILDEIGKELPITIGVTVDSGAIDNVRVLEFRESRGWEVRYPFFTEQFVDARLGNDARLDTKIDGITGATLSVGAVTRIARAALLLHEHVVADQQVAGGE
ncbi:MAG: FMN-binding protein [Gammaproteobacteria bacterium]|nr:FMN-binding protein [Gammaproteobacteria bacterium]NNF49781.1 FMN-binding protein [Woeseiaceae bacterium]MBT8094160.1 FMN-binding protein [Gammaproteobacteria bacterium]MBT8104545.1 FMN-binding protein [Gammaproteobacteria bacterium]NNK24559.1 FMN-binding protein [Woeseiaceae bacterium]